MAEQLRPYFFVVALVALLVWESVHPFFNFFTKSTRDRARHVVRNMAIAVVNAIVVGAVFVALWAWAAWFSESRGIGLLHQFPLSTIAHALLAIVILDAWTYCWHRLNHTVPLLWRFHRMHHSDTQMDVSTANRFHFGEIALSSALRVPLILLLGVRLPELVAYEVMMFAVVQFHHANVGLPERLDRALRLFIVTPAMHKVHHSRERIETNSNYTSFLSIWDRLFGTFRLNPNPASIRMGINELDHAKNQSLVGLVKTPFVNVETDTHPRGHLIAAILAIGALMLGVGGSFLLRDTNTIDWPTTRALIARDFPTVRTISPAELNALLNTTDHTSVAPLLFDVRGADEFAVSHLPRAVRVEPGAGAEALPAGVDTSAPIVVYCSVGYRSAAFAERLNQAGFTNVKNLEGSIFRWANENRPLSRDGHPASFVHPYNETWGTLLNPSHHATVSPDHAPSSDPSR